MTLVKSSETTKEGTEDTHHKYLAARLPVGSVQPVVVGKNGVRHTLRYSSGETRDILSVGLACSESFSGPQLAKILHPGLEFEKKVMQDMMNGTFASPLSIHTSGGVPEALNEFIKELEFHLPWKDNETNDWCVSLQLEGASAVWAAIDLLLQTQFLSGNLERKNVAVGAMSYHGPPSTSLGSSVPLLPKNQLIYPVPTPGTTNFETCLSQFSDFLERHGSTIGVLIIEPQWGSSQAGFPWPKQLLKQYIFLAKSKGILVCADEIMCGLGRHGQGTLFLSKAWGLDVDAVTFGKAIGAGVFPLSGCIMRRGASKLGAAGKTVIQSHTFSGSSARALMTATEVLRELPKWFESISKLGEEMSHIFRYLSKISNGMLITHGQGLMWGSLFTNQDNCQPSDDRFKCFRKNCDLVGVLPYFTKNAGFMVTPVVDIDVGALYEIGEKLEQAIKLTVMETSPRLLDHVPMKVDSHYTDVSSVMLPKVTSGPIVETPKYCSTSAPSNLSTTALCSSVFHVTRSCTSCPKFVSESRRMRFLLA